MNWIEDLNTLASRRAFLARSSTGLGALALGSLLNGKLSAAQPQLVTKNAGVIKTLDFAPRAKRVIYLFMAGAPSTLDLFDNKPVLKKYDGQPCPEEITKGERFAFIQGTPKLLGSPFNFKRYGKSGQEISDLLPHLAEHASRGQEPHPYDKHESESQQLAQEEDPLG